MSKYRYSKSKGEQMLSLKPFKIAADFLNDQIFQIFGNKFKSN